MKPLVDKFPTDFYDAHDILTCPNGDKVRSDEEGLFCWTDGDRTPYPVTAKVVVAVSPSALIKGNKNKKSDAIGGDAPGGDAAGGEGDANG